MKNILSFTVDLNWTETRRAIRLAIVLMLFSVSLLAMTVPASATDTPTKLIVFTDKKVYSDGWNNPRSTDADNPQGLRPVTGGVFSEDFHMIIYAIVLDENGRLLLGQSDYFTSRTVDDVKLLDHGTITDESTHHTNVIDNPTLLDGIVTVPVFSDDGTGYDTGANDGIYTAYVDLPDYSENKGGSGGSTWFRWQIGASSSNVMDQNNAHLLVAVNITFYNGVDPSLQGNTSVLFSQFNCHQGAEGDHPNPHATAVDGAATDVCNECHIGYDHLYNYMDYPELPSDFGDVAHANKLVPPAALANITSGANSPDVHYNTTYGGDNTNDITTWSVFLDQGDTSDYCYVCHFNQGTTILDYGAGADRSDITERPSCSVASKNLIGGTVPVTCHATTNISETSIPAWDPPAATTTHMLLGNTNAAGSHNHSENSPKLPCAGCHLSIHSIIVPQPNPTSYTDINEQCSVCHSSTGPSSHGGSTTDCASCHADDSSKLDAHLVPVGKAGAPDCERCHDISASNPVSIDVDITNMSSGAHANLNSLATSSGSNASNEKCWACHGTLVGTWADESEQPIDSHNSTYYNNPRTCPDCHENTDTNTNFSAPQLAEHKEGAPVVPTTGTQCSICHNNSLTTIAESDGFGISGGDAQNASVSHYLTNTTLMTAQNKSDDCIWCHITNTANASWSTPTYPNVTANYTHTAQNRDQNSDCYGCHGGLTAGVIFHDTGIAAGVAPGPDCIACHDVDGAAGFDVDVTNMASGTHNNLNNLSTVSALSAENKRCWACHGVLAGGDADESDQPATGHPANYNSPRVCPECHENTDPGTNFSAPQVVEHTESAPTVPTASIQCSLCHNNSLTAITEIDGYGLSAGGNAQNATASHYSRDANDNLMTGSIHSDDCIWCHITNTANASWGTPFDPQNSSSYPHTADNVAQNDTCYGCHGGLSASVNFHDTGITAGSAGGQDCISCHDGTTGNKVNIVNMNQSNSIHSVVNNGGNATGSADNKMCYACHTNDTYISGGMVNDTGIPTDSHPTGYDTPKNCTLCHTNTNSGTNFSAPQVSEHISTGTDLKTRSYADLNDSCTACHITTEMLSSYTDTTGTDYSNVSHYGISRNNTALVTNNVVDCAYCHQNASTAFDFVDNNNYTLSNHSSNYPATNPACTECHSSGRMHDAGLTTPTLNDTLCVGCHTTRENHATTVQCVSCHVDSTATRDKVHPVKYINASAGFATSNTTAVNCTNCHQQNVTGFSAAPMVPFPLNHSDDPLAGGKWDSYWDNTSQLSSCIYCHGDTKHNNDSLGRISSIASGDVINGTINGSGNWCAGCHVQTDSDYNKMVANYTNVTVPPEITGNGTYGANSSNSAFFSHSGWSNYSDAYCLDCHGNYVTGSTMDEFMHDVSVGEGCSNCHYDYSFMSTRNPERYVNETMYAASVHAILDCEDCHTKGHNNIGARKACEDCHVVQADPKNDTNRHNITNDPLNNMVGGNSSVYITDCTVCHDSTIYNDSITNFNKDATYDCDWCHTYPDKNNEYFY